MRALFLLLVAANLAFFAWWRTATPTDAAAPVSRALEPEKLKIIAPAQLPAPAPPVAEKKPAPAAAPALACMEWGSFTLADAPKAEKALEPLALGGRLAQRRSEETAAWWVFMPPQGTRQLALRKAAELKKLGVDEYFIVQEEGEHRWALSLGIFRTEEGAQARLAALQARGVRTARVGPREMVVPKVWLQVKGVDAPLETRLREIARQVEGTELRACS
jgi:hypothetical protein